MTYPNVCAYDEYRDNEYVYVLTVCGDVHGHVVLFHPNQHHGYVDDVHHDYVCDDDIMLHEYGHVHVFQLNEDKRPFPSAELLSKRRMKSTHEKIK